MDDQPDQPLDVSTAKFILDQVKRFSAGVICEGDNSTHENQLINKYADGTVKGYNDAVKQITEMLEDLINAEGK